MLQSLESCLDSAPAKEHVKCVHFITLKIVSWVAITIFIITLLLTQASYYKKYDVESAIKVLTSGSHPNLCIKRRDKQDRHHCRSTVKNWTNPENKEEIFISTHLADVGYQTMTFGQSNINCSGNVSTGLYCEENRELDSKDPTTTGKCVKNTTGSNYVCEINDGWKPDYENAEHLQPSDDNWPLANQLDKQKIFIRIRTHFDTRPKIYKTNFPKKENSSSSESPNCVYNKQRHRHCPVFTLKSLANSIQKNYTDLAVKGAHIKIFVKWDCSLDSNDLCRPTYKFTFMDGGVVKTIYQDGNTTYRKVQLLYGLRITVKVSGFGKKFDFWECVKSIGSLLSYFGIAGLITGIVASKLQRKEKTNTQKSTDEQNPENAESTSATASHVDAVTVAKHNKNYFARPGELQTLIETPEIHQEYGPRNTTTD